jgi:hypothetical protein
MYLLTMALEDAHATFHAPVGLALAHRGLDRGSAIRECRGDGVAQRLQRPLTVATDEHTAAVPEFADADDRAVDVLLHVDPFALEHPGAECLGVAVAHD